MVRLACVACWLVGFALPATSAAAVELRQIVSREHPVFVGTGHGLAVDRDGNAYLYNSAGGKGYVLRLSLDGRERFGGETAYAITGVAVGKDGRIATSNAHFAKAINIYNPDFRLAGKAEGFTGNDQVGWNGPGGVEAGASGDFYALDQHANRIVRVAADGRIVRSYPVDAEGKPGRSSLRDHRFRVCEATQSFVFHAGDVLRCSGFDGRTRWTLKAPLSGNEYDGFRGDFDLDEAGTLHLLAGDKPRVERFTPAGEPAGSLDLQMGDAGPTAAQPLSALRVQGDRIVVRRKSDTELFQVFDREGRRLRVASIRYEKLTVRFESPVWIAGRRLPLSIGFEAPGRSGRPDLRCWLRPLGTVPFVELPVEDGRVDVPADWSGLYQLRVGAGLRGGESEYQVQTVVEVRPPDAVGSVSILTPGNRSAYGHGESISGRIVMRAGREAASPKEVTIELKGETGSAAWRGIVEVSPEGRGEFAVSADDLRKLTPGRYRFTTVLPQWTVADQWIEIGSGIETPPTFSLIQHGDYRVSYPDVSYWNAPEWIDRRVRAARRLGLNMFVDRIGHGGGGVLHELPQALRDAELSARLRSDPIAVAPEKAEFDNRVLQSVAKYGAAGIEQRGILLYMDAGLPVGTGFDKRTDAEYERDVTLASSMLKDFAAFRGWSWAANWWIGQRGPAAAKSPEQKGAYEAALKTARETGRWDKVLDDVSDVWIGHAVEAEQKFDAILQRAAPGRLSVMTGPYRQPGIHPPLTFANADEVDLHWQSEQIQWPLIAGHAVDFYKRPGKRAWAHPELWNDDGTGGQILAESLFYVMRGADGVGQSGSTHGFAPPPSDSRGMGPGATSVHRALNRLLRTYGPWLTTFEAADPVAIPVSTRMMRLDLEWKGIGGRYFTRLYEAYNACLFAHRPASFVFAEDCRPDSLAKFRAVLLIDQEVELDPPLAEALKVAAAKRVPVWHDRMCRAELVSAFRPLDVEFTRVENDPHVLNDDSAFVRFREHFLDHARRLAEAWERILPPVAECPHPEVLLTERRRGDVRHLWALNRAIVPLDPAHLWRVSLAVASRMPVRTVVRWPAAAGLDVYDAFTRRRVDATQPIPLDLSTFPARLLVGIPKGAKLDEHLPPSVGAGEDVDVAFGARLRDVAVDANDRVALVTAAGWDRNLFMVDLHNGTVRRPERVGHHYAYAPVAAESGFAVQGFDLNAPEGFHLFALDAAGRAEQRFALPGLPKRGTSWATANAFLDPINNFAVSPDGAWVAAAGDLGLVLWSRDGRKLWSDEWWRTERRRVSLVAAGRSSLVTLNGTTATARDPQTGNVQWTQTLGETGRLVRGVATADGATIALRSTAEGGRVFLLRDGKPANVLPTAADDVALSPDGRRLGVVNREELRLFDADGGLRWTFTGDEILRSPRFDHRSQRLAVGSELGTLTVLDTAGQVVIERDLGALPVAAWLGDGGLFVATWLGTVARFDSHLRPLWSKTVRPDAAIDANELLAADATPTVRLTGWGNAAKESLPLTPNLLAESQALLEARFDPAAPGDPRHWRNPIQRLTDGDPAPPDEPWLEWTDLSYLDSGWRSRLVIQADTFRTQLRVTGVTIVEDPKHPESWQRDLRLQWWDPKSEAWRDGPYLLSDQATHSHVFEKTIEAAKFRFVSTGGGSWPANNVRWGELVFHGEALGPSHPDAVANRAVAVLFDEQENDLRSMMAYGGRPFAFQYDDAASGGKCLALTAAGETAPHWRPPFGHVLPNWDFQIVENPQQPGEYRWLEFSWKALSPKTEGMTLRLGPHHGGGVAVSAGDATKFEGALVRRDADQPPASWTTVRLDLWKAVGKPLGIRSLSLGAVGGGAAFDRILLGRTEADLDAHRPDASGGE